MSNRPTVTVQGNENSVQLPKVFDCPIRADVVHFVQYNMAKNSRQPYAVTRHAGMILSAESWGTGRARARIPRIKASGTRRSGQGAFGNMCRGGRMFAPTKTWRNWHVKLNLNMKRYAVCSAVAASAQLSLVKARGHKVENIPQIPLVVEDTFESIQKTSEAKEFLVKVGAFADVEKITTSKNVRAGKGKMRGRRFKQRRGPLVVYNEDQGIVRSLRNLKVDTCHVDRLNLLQLAPGGHLGRFVIWTESAFNKLDEVFDSKNGFTLPRNIVTNSDFQRIITSEEIQNVIREKQAKKTFSHKNRNPLVNKEQMKKISPYAAYLSKLAKKN
eukprot:TRINITY_DN2238_c2_g1_i1.p1 TRINITY_DN2238_c2_g1~~TRINITY_DN2238_c2_g1_i1.p1  ORF type:complete len:329 (+),score=66.35 TRINITY_DN2238_c2_g1_i1:49-1035(+)